MAHARYALRSAVPALCLAALLGLPGAAVAADSAECLKLAPEVPIPDFAVVFDLSALEGSERRTYSFSTRSAAGAAAVRLMESAGPIPIGDDLPVRDAAAPVTPKQALECLRLLIETSSIRFVSRPGDTVAAYVFSLDTAPPPKVEFVEAKRPTQLATDLRALIKVIRAIRDQEEEAFEEPGIVLYRQTKALELTRAKVTVTAEQQIPAPGAGEAEGEEPAEDAGGEAVRASTVLVSGPPEHWSISANVAVNALSEVKFNDTSRQLELRDRPSRWLAGMDYFWGDLANPDARGLVVKLLLEASKEPARTVGAALGWRSKTLQVRGFELDAFSPFAGVVRVRNDVERDDGTIDQESDYEFVGGLTFNLDTALGWIQGNGEDE